MCPHPEKEGKNKRKRKLISRDLKVKCELEDATEFAFKIIEDVMCCHLEKRTFMEEEGESLTTLIGALSCRRVRI